MTEYGEIPEKVVLHCDMNNYFASVECLYNPALRKVPMAVCGDPDSRHGIVLAKNDLAKQFGVVTGESIYTAKAKCPSLTTVTANYDRYLEYTRKARAIYARYSDMVTPYGLDEAWVELDKSKYAFHKGIQTAEEIRNSVKKELGLTVSVGVSYNYIYAKLASDLKKPDAVTVISKDNYKRTVWNRPAFELLFVGSATRRKLYRLGILSIGDLATCDPVKLSREIGKRGYTLWEFANGDDRNFCPTITSDDELKSIGNTITAPADIDNQEDIAALLYVICACVSKRLDKHRFKARCVGIHVRRSDFSAYSRRESFANAVGSPDELFEIAYRIFSESYDWSKPVRSVGVFAEKLCDAEYEQLCLFDERAAQKPDMIRLVQNLREKLGRIKFEETATQMDEVPDIDSLFC
ncbi:MAG TPA: DNA polymerase IV [Bacillota bacterium]|nr:DNA polymerase IV [Bacillota bacterium]HPP84621.1 DNA polymerase IV [Bacillota bacterium]